MHHSSLPSSSPADAARQFAPPAFACTRRPDGWSSAWIDLVGELDLATCPRFERVLREAQDEASTVSIDLQELSFIDGSGLRAIVTAAARDASAKTSLTLVGPRGQVERLIGLTGLAKTVEVIDFDSARAR
jgi:anti-anti-sigma factor